MEILIEIAGFEFWSQKQSNSQGKAGKSSSSLCLLIQWTVAGSICNQLTATSQAPWTYVLRQFPELTARSLARAMFKLLLKPWRLFHVLQEVCLHNHGLENTCYIRGMFSGNKFLFASKDRLWGWEHIFISMISSHQWTTALPLSNMNLTTELMGFSNNGRNCHSWIKMILLWHCPISEKIQEFKMELFALKCKQLFNLKLRFI